MNQTRRDFLKTLSASGVVAIVPGVGLTALASQSLAAPNGDVGLIVDGARTIMPWSELFLTFDDRETYNLTNHPHLVFKATSYLLQGLPPEKPLTVEFSINIPEWWGYTEIDGAVLYDHVNGTTRTIKYPRQRSVSGGDTINTKWKFYATHVSIHH